MQQQKGSGSSTDKGQRLVLAVGPGAAWPRGAAEGGMHAAGAGAGRLPQGGSSLRTGAGGAALSAAL